MSARNHLESAFDEVKGWDPGPLKRNADRNLLILVAKLPSVDLADFALRGLENENILIRYWAVKALVGPELVSQLDSSSNAALADTIVQQFEKLVQKENQSVILNMIAGFAVSMDTSDTKELLLKVADNRIERYRGWDVQGEISEAALLKVLSSQIMVQSGEEKKATLRKFAQLYSFVIQRYVNGADVLEKERMQQLVSVIVEIEQTVLNQLLGMSQSAIKRAIEKKDIDSIVREHDSLLGSAVRMGALGRKLNFDYGKSSSGRAITAPEKLPSPPQPISGETSAETE
jgi:hypothetical protein